MFFSDTDKAIIKDYHEREYAAYKLWKGNPEKQNSGEATYIEIEAFGTMERQKCSGRPRRATTPKNEEVVKEVICSQEGHPRVKDLIIFCIENDEKKRNKKNLNVPKHLT